MRNFKRDMGLTRLIIPAFVYKQSFLLFEGLDMTLDRRLEKDDLSQETFICVPPT